MSGTDWTDDHPGDPAQPSPLNGPWVAPSFVTVPNLDQAHAQPPEPAMDHPHLDSDQDETEPTEAVSSPGPGPLWKILTLIKKIPLPSMGSERHEMLSHVNRTHPVDPHAEPAEHYPIREPSRFPLLHLKRETRVGIAAVVSFVALVTALVVQKKMAGTSPVLALPSEGEPEKKAKAEEEAKTKKAEEEAKTKKAEEEAKTKKQEPETRTVGTEPGSTEKPTTELPPVATNEPKQSDLAIPTKTDNDRSKLPKVGPDEPTLPSLPATTSVSPTELPKVGPDEPSLPTMIPGPGSGSEPGSEPKPAPVVTVAEPPKTPAIPEPTPSTPPSPTDLLPNPNETKTATVEPVPVPATSVALPAIAPPEETAPKPAEPAPVSPPGPPPAPPESLVSPIPPVAATPPPSTTPTIPVPTEKAPPLESVPPSMPNSPALAASAPIEPSATTTSMANAATPGAGWVAIQSGGRRIPGAGTIVSTPLDSDISRLGPANPARVTDGPRPRSDLALADQYEPVFHTVQTGENFWTISRLYYNSGRYYKALHAANKRQVPGITDLVVGMVINVPPIEKLDRSLIGRETSTATKAARKPNPTEMADLAQPTSRPRLIRPEPEVEEAPRRPTYKVSRNFETVRSIARDTLEDSGRYKEILNLNSDLDPKAYLAKGTVLTLPEDAKVRGVR